MINLGNKIRELRKNRGITQEGLASALNMSPQAVSKWEMSASYPDVAMLPVIAAYFGISLDALFDYDPEEIEEKIKQIIISVNHKRSFEEREKILLDGIAAYPGSDKLKCELLERYAGQIRAFKKNECKDRALALGEKLLAESRDTLIILSAKASIADIYISTGNYEAGKKIIESMPYIYHLDIYDRMRCSSMFLNGEDGLRATREWKVWAHQELFMICSDEGKRFFDAGDYENALLSFREAIETIGIFINRKVPDEYRLLGGEVKQAFYTVCAAACLYRLGRIDECDTELERSYSLLRSCFNSEESPKFKNMLHQYRELYVRMRLDEYKPCV